MLIYCLLAIPYSLLATPYSLLPIPYSVLAIPYLPFAYCCLVDLGAVLLPGVLLDEAKTAFDSVHGASLHGRVLLHKRNYSPQEWTIDKTI